MAYQTSKEGEVTTRTRVLRQVEVTVHPIPGATSEDEFVIYLNGRPISRLNPHRARQLGLIPVQDPLL